MIGTPLWEAMVWKPECYQEQPNPEHLLQHTEELLRSGQSPNEEWDHDSWLSDKNPGGCAVTTIWPEDLEYCSSPMFFAILRNNIELTKLLVEHGADMERRTRQGMTALHLAVRLMKRDVVKLLATYGANLEAQTIDGPKRSSPTVTGCFALHYAVLSDRLDILKDLLELGADVQVVTTAEWSILDLAILYQRVDIIDYLSRAYPILLNPYAQNLEASSVETNEDQCRKDSQIAGQLLSTGAADTNNQHRRVFLDCMRQTWNRIDLVGERTVRAGKSILEEAETALIRMAGLSDKLSWDQKFCAQCSEFAAQETHLLSESFEHSSEISHIKQSGLYGCPLCQILSESLERAVQSYSRTTDSQSIEGSTISLKVDFPSPYTGFFNGDDLGALVVHCGKITCKIDLGLVDEQTRLAVFNTEPNDVYGSSSTRSIAVAKAWLDHCELRHDQCRIQPLPKLPTRVIAVGDESKEPFLFCSPQSVARYTVLSYRWGGITSLQTTKANLEQHFHKMPFQEMPKTVQDAVTITRGLGIQYLWVDSLCIVQDSVEDFKQQAALMGDIYANATLTIAAKDASDSTTGCFSNHTRKSTVILPMNFLFPKGSGDEPRRIPRINKAMLIPKLDVVKKGDTTAALDSRGWTLQEQLLSRRILNCGKSELSWSCLERNCSESEPRTSTAFWGVKEDSAYVTRLALARKSKFKSKPLEGDELFGEWLKVVQEYSQRQLSDPRDKIFALAGLQSRFATILCDTPLLGGWRDDYLWLSLLWYCQSTNQDIVTEESSYPSWAWPSASGPVTFLTRGLKRDSPFDPTVIAWNLDVVEQDVKVSGSVTVRCRLLPWSVFHANEEDFNDRDEFTFGPLLAAQTRFWQELHRIQEAEKAGSTAGGEASIRGNNANRTIARNDRRFNEYYFMLVADIPWRPPPKYGYPASPGGMPASALFIVLKKISPIQLHFRKVALYQEREDSAWRDQLQEATIEIF